MFFNIVFVSVIITVCFALNPIKYIGQSRVEAFYPRGLAITVPDNDFDIVFVEGSLNQPINHLTIGTLRFCSSRPPSNDSVSRVWVFTDNSARVKIGDEVNYWISFKKGEIERKTMLEKVIVDLRNQDGTRRYSNPSTVEARENEVDPYCDHTETEIQGEIVKEHICKDDLIFSEEFEGPLSSSNRWVVEEMFPEGPDFPFNVYRGEEMVTIENGTLIIKPKLLDENIITGELDLSDVFSTTLTSCTGRLDTTECQRVAFAANILPPVASGKVSSRRRFNFKYGKVEVRAKLPVGDWLVPEINLEPRHNVYGDGNYASGIIRIAFVRGNPGMGRSLYGGPILSSKEPIRSKFLKEKVGGEEWNKEFHNYSMIWKRDGITLAVDGVTYGVVPAGSFLQLEGEVSHARRWASGSAMAPLDQMFHLTLGIRAGGAGDFPDSGPKPYRDGDSKAALQYWAARDRWLPSWGDARLMVDYFHLTLGIRAGGSGDFPDSGPKPYRDGDSKAALQYWAARDRWLPSWGDARLMVDYSHLTLGIRAGGAGDFPDSGPKPYRDGDSKAALQYWAARDRWLPSWGDARLMVDYVRVYAV
ncbi:beta-1,3-glucan-binding protein isoform X1 [Plutella xylostella]|uniref:beta-1,3-glucan-binding protein isoform X1 n=1 Tax=Plutella xylostella TaxID=51655 RepID=UPI0020323762|nr:beta-1,3-glucan-binding protein isoform X1 [Plutella xylostella]